MAVISSAPATTATDDPLLPHLWSIKSALDKLHLSEKDAEDLYELLYRCVETFKHDPAYQNDVRFLKIWLLYENVTPLKTIRFYRAAE